MKAFKKIAFFLAALLTVSCLAPMAVMAEDAAVSTYDTAGVGYSASRVVKNPEVDTYTNLNTVTKLSELTKEKYKITDAAGLKNLADLVNSATAPANKPFSGKTVYLANDINMAGYDFTPIGYTSTASSNDADNATANTHYYNTRVFCGTFDGQGYTISNLSIEKSDSDGKIVCVGLFGVVKGATIKNVVLDSTCAITYSGSSNEARVGGIAGTDYYAAVEVYNCYSATTVNITKAVSNGEASGIMSIYVANSSIEYCTYAGSLVKGYARSAGICARIGNVNASIEYCRNSGTIQTYRSSGSTSYAAAGICAAPNNGSTTSSTINKCVNNGEIISYGNTANIGGIVGIVRTNSVCTNNVDYGVVRYASTVSNPPAITTYIYGGIYTNETANGVNSTNKVQRGHDFAMVHGYQLRKDDNATTMDVRFVGSIDSLDYSEVGLEITVSYVLDGKTVTKELGKRKCEYVYDSLLAVNGDNTETYTAKSLRKSETDGYLFAITLNDIPVAAGNLTFTVIPYCVSMEKADPSLAVYEGAKISGVTKEDGDTVNDATATA